MITKRILNHMKVALISNYLNHHQLPFCQAMDRYTDGNFYFIATEPISDSRKKLGYVDMDKQYPFVITTYDSEENLKRAKALALDCDVVIIGSASDGFITERLKKNRQTFKYSERFYKKGISLKYFPRALVGAWLHHGRFQKYPLYMLCASAYTAADCAIFGNYLERTYKWGYFPEVKEQNLDELFACKRMNKKTSILWVARLIGWKHPDASIYLAERLKKNGYSFDMNLIGIGEMEEQLKASIHDKGLEDCVHMLGAMAPDQVRVHMEQADIFLFTSDFNEGWGAVLNESMNSGCAVVASHAIGSVPFLIKDGENGFIYKNGDEEDLYKKVKRLIENPELREAMGKQAYGTLADTWNADVAAGRVLKLAEALINGENTELFLEGPCSKAKNLMNNWYESNN